MADIYGGFDFLAAGNALSQMQSGRIAQENARLQQQYTMEDRARAAQERSAARGNALAERAAISKALENSVIGAAGPEQPNLKNAANNLALSGRLGPASAMSNYLEQIAKQQEQEAKAAGQGLINEETRAKTEGQLLTNTGTDFKNTADFIKMTNAQIDAAPNLDALKAIVMATHTPGHPMAAFNKLNKLTPEAAIAGIDALVAQGKTFDEIRAQMSQGATAAAKNFADLAQSQAATKSSEAAATSSLATAAKTNADVAAAAEKRAWELANPEFTIVDTASGKVKVSKRTGKVEPLTLDGQTLMPYVKPDPNAVALTPQALDVAAHTYILTGVLPPGMGKNSTEIRTQIMNHATELANGRSAEEFAQDLRVNRNDTAAMKNATTAFGTGTQGKMVNSFNTAIDHLETINDLVAALQNNDTKRINSVSNAIASEFGVAAPANFEAAKQLVSSEIVKAINSSGGALADRQEAESSLSLANSPEQLKGVVDTFQKLLGGQLKSLELQYTNMTGKKDFNAKLTDKAKTALDRVSGSAKTDTVKNTSTLPNTNAKGWVLHTDKSGNQAYVSPDGKNYEEVK